MTSPEWWANNNFPWQTCSACPSGTGNRIAPTLNREVRITTDRSTAINNNSRTVYACAVVELCTPTTYHCQSATQCRFLARCAVLKNKAATRIHPPHRIPSRISIRALTGPERIHGHPPCIVRLISPRTNVDPIVGVGVIPLGSNILERRRGGSCPRFQFPKRAIAEGIGDLLLVIQQGDC
jgi:hypothetical protein